MEYLSITQSCSAATTAILKTSPTLRNFIREVREARPDLDAILAELHSLEGVLGLLHDDGHAFPEDLARRTPPLLEHCASIVNQIEGYMHVCNGLGLTRRDKKFRWLAIRMDMLKLRLTLEGYKSILAMVTDLVGLTTSCQENDTLSIASDSSRYQDALDIQSSANEDLCNDLTRVLADMGSLRGRLQGDFRSNYAVSDLASYLDAMQLHATNLGYRLDAVRCDTNPREGAQTPEIPRKSAERNSHGLTATRQPAGSNSSSVGDEPDSAIDMNDGPPSPSSYQRSPTTGRFDAEPARTETRASERTTLTHRPLIEPQTDDRPLPIVEIEEFIDELREPSTRAPTPPPRARARGFSSASNALRTEALLNNHPSATLTPFSAENLPGLCRPPSARSLSEYSAMHHDTDGNPIVPRRVSSLRSLPGSACGSDADARSTVGSLRAIRSPYAPDSDDFGGAYEGRYGNRSVITTTITGGAAARRPTYEDADRPDTAPAPSSSLMKRTSKLFGRKNSFRLNPPARPPRPDSPQTLSNHHQQPSNASSSDNEYLTALQGSGLVYNPVEAARTASLKSKPSFITPTPTLRAHSHHPRKASVDTTKTKSTAASIRSNSSRLSSVFNRISIWRPQTSSSSSTFSSKAPPEEIEPDDIFGVSLKKSMQMASATVRTHHDGSKASSRRDFPRCVLLCVSFLKENDGVRAPHIFGSGGDMAVSDDAAHVARIAALKEAFSTAPWYGEGNITWTDYDVYDAAELIVLFLQQLRKPLVSETVAKRWIVMSKQATLPGSMGLRLDSCLDFWDEALLGVRGAARSLLKLLLNLWGDIADAAEVNEMTAERLAARLLGPLMHLPQGKYTTDYMLGLAFLIRKRSEYAIMLREGRRSHAAF